MSEPLLESLPPPESEDGPLRSLLDAFHRINNILPDEEVICVEADTSVSEALALLAEHNFSQVPVLAGDTVIGMFSYRSFGRAAVEHCAEKVDIGELAVDDFVEPVQFVSINAGLPDTFDPLDQDNAMIAGTQEQVLGILTPVDVLRYLYEAASPFVLIAEIEQTIRRIIEACCTAEELATCISNALTKAYEGSPPDALEDMTFHDYKQIISDGRNWELFAPAFGGANDYQRRLTGSRLKDIGDLRNDVFHFKREIVEEDRLKLAEHRTWLWYKALRVRAHQQRTDA